jgi:hypothetical protein
VPLQSIQGKCCLSLFSVFTFVIKKLASQKSNTTVDILTRILRAIMFPENDQQYLLYNTLLNFDRLIGCLWFLFIALFVFETFSFCYICVYLF